MSMSKNETRGAFDQTKNTRPLIYFGFQVENCQSVLYYRLKKIQIYTLRNYLRFKFI